MKEYITPEITFMNAEVPPQPQDDSAGSDSYVVDLMLKRLMEGLQVDSQVALAELLGISGSAITNAKTRGNIPREWLVTALGVANLNPFWVTGESTKRYIDPHMDRGII